MIYTIVDLKDLLEEAASMEQWLAGDRVEAEVTPFIPIETLCHRILKG